MSDPFRASQAAVRTYDIRRRTVPIAHLEVGSTTEGAAQTLFTVPESCEVAIINRLTVRNDTGAAIDLSLYTVPSGETIGALHLELDAYSVAANTTLAIEDLLGRAYARGTACKVFASAIGGLFLRGMMTQER